MNRTVVAPDMLRVVAKAVDPDLLEMVPDEQAAKIFELAVTDTPADKIVERTKPAEARHMDLSAILADLANLASIATMFLTIYQIRADVTREQALESIKERVSPKLGKDKRISKIAEAAYEAAQRARRK